MIHHYRTLDVPEMDKASSVNPIIDDNGYPFNESTHPNFLLWALILGPTDNLEQAWSTVNCSLSIGSGPNQVYTRVPELI